MFINRPIKFNDLTSLDDHFPNFCCLYTSYNLRKRWTPLTVKHNIGDIYCSEGPWVRSSRSYICCFYDALPVRCRLTPGGRFVKVVLLSRCLLCSVSFYDYSVTSMSYCAVLTLSIINLLSLRNYVLCKSSELGGARQTYRQLLVVHFWK